MRTALFLVLAVAASAPVGATTGPHEHGRDQDAAWQAAREGRFKPLREIEARVLPKMRGYTYLGPEIYPEAGRYRLKFMRGPRVVWIDVDARSGAVVDTNGF